MNLSTSDRTAEGAFMKPSLAGSVVLTLALCLGISGCAGNKPQDATRVGDKPQEVSHVGAKPLDVRRFGDKSLETVIRTDERHGHNGLFQRPRGRDYWKYLEAPSPIQNPNLWPDMQSTYFFGYVDIPAGATLTLRMQFPQTRYFQLALYKSTGESFIATDSLTGPAFEPDPGSTNTFRVGANRLAEKRSTTVQLVAKDAPAKAADRGKNTMYIGSAGGEVFAVIRVYLSDESQDGAGWGPATTPSAGSGPSYEMTLADGTKLSAAEVVKRYVRAPKANVKPPVTTAEWEKIVNNPRNDPTLDPATAPARKVPRWEKFGDLKYSVFGAFLPPQERAKIPFTGGGTGGADPETQYSVLYLSRKFGPVYVMRGKMPTFPNTYKNLAVMPAAQMQYWSLGSIAAPPSGQTWDAVADMQVALDAQGYYTIVVSRPEDRPKNATAENGITWLNWGPGEGLDSPANRTDWGMLMMRIMDPDPNWAESPARVTKPGMEEAVMGPYYPRGYYTDKASFEAQGVRK